MIRFDVLNRFTGAVQFTAEIDCAEDTPRSMKMRLAVVWAVKSRANLSGANLSRADLSRADLSGADLSRADLYGADLSRANLSGAILYGAILYGANLSRANLSGAILYGADLSGANLYGADLSGANLSRANLSGAGQIASRVIDGGLRSDGYRFLLTRTEPGEWRVKAGCKNFTIAEAESHWSVCRPVGDPLGDETRLIIAHMLALAKLRQWPEAGKERAAAQSEAA